MSALASKGSSPVRELLSSSTFALLPFVTASGSLVTAVRAAIHAETGLDAQLSTTGGTSDARFLAKICPQVVEFGPPNASIHQIDEFVRRDDVDILKNIYRRILENLHRDGSA